MKKLDYQGSIPDMRFGIDGTCTYCGGESECIDHVIPWAYIANHGEARSNHRGLTTPACNWCNARLGSKMFPSMLERLMHIETKARTLAKKHKKAPAWADEEIMELDGSLRVYVIKSQLEMRMADRVSSWAYAPKFRRVIDTVRSSAYFEYGSPLQNRFVVEFFRDLVDP